MKYEVVELFRNRESYADRYYVSEDTFAIADGLGFGEGAKFAAEKVIELVEKFKPYDSQEKVREAFKKINQELIKELGKFGDEAISGTTLSLISFNGNRFFLGHVGDSRIYLLRNGSLKLLTKDQVKVKGSKKIVQVMGLSWNVDVFTSEGEIKEGDIILLVSDGFLKVFESSNLPKFTTVEELIKSVKDFKKEDLKDDITFILVYV